MTRTAGFVRIVVTLVVAVAALVAIRAGYRTYTDRYIVTTNDDGKAVARVVQMTFTGASDLKVGMLHGTVQSVGADPGWFAWLDSSYVMKAPFSVEYFVDLSRMGPGDFGWDERRKRLTVHAPMVRVGPPDIDEARIYIEDTKGVFVTRAMMARMRVQASAGAQRVAAVEARKPDKLEAARSNARAALARILGGPLRAAGLGQVTVDVVFPDDVHAREHWDTSRSLQDVLGNRS